MRFLKVSIVFLFLLSLLSAGVTFYLSTIRENEKEKRIYLEGVRTKLEEQVSTLEGEKKELEQKNEDLESKNKELNQKFKAEADARKKALDLVREKDLQIDSLKEDKKEASDAFNNAEKRNKELERILDELEARMRQLETQNQPPEQPEVGYVQVSLNPVNLQVPAPTPPAQTQTPPQTQASEKPIASDKLVADAVSPVTALPKPPKRRKFFPFFHSSKEKKLEESKVSTQVQEIKKEEPQSAIFKAVPSEAKPPQAAAPSPAKTEPLSEPKPQAPAARKTDQNIAAGNILLVNRKYNFLVTNLGSKQGLSLDDVLKVQHDGVQIAKARVEKIYDDYCAAYIVEERSEQPIAEGDMVAAA